MKSMRRAPLAAAVTAALIGLGSAVNTVDAATFSLTGTGQVLVLPYYTVNGGWITTFNILNTSDKTLAVKVRFHEKKNSRDVLDFNIVMSPHDAWTGYVKDSPDGPQIFTDDKTCTSPRVINGVTASTVAYTGPFDDTGGTTPQRMRDGYVELLLMGVAPAGAEDNPNLNDHTQNTVPQNAAHINGIPLDCGLVDKAFIATTPTFVGDNPLNYTGTITNSLAGSGDPPARDDFLAPAADDLPLKGTVTWLQAGTGAGAGSAAIALGAYSTGVNWVTAQQFPWFLEPTFATDPTTTLWTVTGVEEFEPEITWGGTVNEWANNPDTGAQTDWVLTFPTKGYHVDKFNDQIQAAVSKYRNNMVDVVDCASNAAADRGTCIEAATSPTEVFPFEVLFGVDGTGDSRMTVTYNLFDREERTTTIESEGTAPSPAPPPEITEEMLRYETNVVQFGDTSVLNSSSPAIVNASAALNGAPYGWAQILFANDIGGVSYGLPVTAFAIKVRTQGEPSSNYGQHMDNGYVPGIFYTPPTN